MLKICDVTQSYLSGKKVTCFEVYKLRGDAWVFDYAATVSGHWKKARTVATKHCAENGRTIELLDWEF